MADTDTIRRTVLDVPMVIAPDGLGRWRICTSPTMRLLGTVRLRRTDDYTAEVHSRPYEATTGHSSMEAAAIDIVRRLIGIATAAHPNHTPEADCV